MKRFLLFIFLIISILPTYSQFSELSDSTTISLITCSPGKEVYAKFGHTAIRLNDPVSHNDLIFNYGIFSFETENFYYKFIKGETDYQLGVYESKYFFPEYASRNSMVWEQILNLNVDEKRKLINSLINNYNPENRIYRYNFVFDNCATRPRDKILSNIYGFAKYSDNTDNKTFRQWIGVYVGTDTWLKLGIDLIFGMDADVISTKKESMFLPEILMEEFETAQIITPNVDSRPLVKSRTIIVHQRSEKAKFELFIFKPLSIALILLILGVVISLLDWNRIYSAKLFDTILFTATGLAGILVLYMMTVSTHPLVKLNLNILWLNPLNLIIAYVLWIKSLRTALFVYQIFNILLITTALIVFALSIQDFNIASFPIIVLLLLRSTAWFAKTKRRIIKRTGSSSSRNLKLID